MTVAAAPRTSNARIGLLWMLGCALFYTAETSIIRSLGPGWPAPVTLFWREIAAILVLAPFVLRQGGRPLRTGQFRWLVFRSATGTAGMLLSIYAIARLPLATATTLSFTRPMWIALIAALVLSEALGRRKLAALLIGFAGIVWMLRPGSDIPDIGAALADLAAAFLFAASLVSIRYMTATETPLTIMIYGQLLGLVFTMPFAIYYWRAPEPAELAILLSVGLVGVCTMACNVRALAVADASVTGAMEYLRLPFAMLAGLAFLGEVPGWTTLGGAALILLAAWVSGTGGRRDQRRGSGGADEAQPQRTARSVEELQHFFDTQLAEEAAAADKHLVNAYWTDSRTGRNVGQDEHEALYYLRGLNIQASVEEVTEATLFLNRVLADIDAIAERFRAEAPDPDGYGIATIGTVARRLREYGIADTTQKC